MSGETACAAQASGQIRSPRSRRERDGANEGGSMRFAVYQSRKEPAWYLFTGSKGGFDAVPEGILEQMGKLKYLRMSREKETETEALGAIYEEIAVNIAIRGYHVVNWKRNA
jgi:uncharacterized protein